MATMQISTHSVDITPPVGTPMAGYGVDTPRLSTGVHRPLQARCSVLWDDGSPNVVVTVDTLAFGHTLHRSIRDKVVALGVGPSDFVLSSSHTHSGAVLTNPDFQAYAKSFGVGAWKVETADQLKGALREAIASNAPALIEVVSDINKDYPPFEFHQPKRPS